MSQHTGVIHGNVIQLHDSPGLPDGATVEVVVSPAKTPGSGAGLLRAAEAFAAEWTEEMDETLRILKEDRQRSDRGLPE